MDCLSLTKKLISFRTINPPGHEHNCARYIGRLLEDGGFQTRYCEFDKGRTSLIAHIKGGGDKDPLCFSGHMDTVPIGSAQWMSNPLKGEVDGDKLYGRGSTDMKSGLAAMVVASLRLSKMPRGKAGITLVITAGEETGCRGAHHLVEQADPLEKAGMIIVGEPTSNYPLLGHKGALWLEAETTGVAAHGSMPERGDNAIVKAARAVTKLQNYAFANPSHPLLGKPTLNIGTISGGLNINSVPDQAHIGIDIRTIPGQMNKDVYEDLGSFLGEEVQISRLIDVGSVITNDQHEWVQKIFDIMTPFLHARPVPRGATYFTDASVLAPALGNPPTIILGPGEPEMAHKPNEFCYTSKIEQAADAYLEIAQKWCEL
ncbi:MAG: M20 family metallopeptidase [Thermodesulfobacteriota bacterium]